MARKSAAPSARKSAVSVSLVSMPFKDLRHPPIQLGLLQACLARRDVRSRTHSLELSFMEHLHRNTRRDEEPLKVTDYAEIATRHFMTSLGDWIFRVPPFAEPDGTDEEYLQYIREDGADERIIAVARKMRQLAPSFLEKAANSILRDRPRIVGFSCIFQQNVGSLALAKILKSRDPNIVIVFGGGNFHGPMGVALHRAFPFIDFVVRGEGEQVFPDLVDDILNGRPVRTLEGLCYRESGETRAYPSSVGSRVNIKDVPMPNYDEFFQQLERSPVKEDLLPDVAILFEGSRGCWWGEKSHCTFCGLNGDLMKFRSKTASQVINEVLSLASRYKILDFVAVDDIIDLAHIREFLPALAEKGCDITIFYETKSNLTKDQIRTLKNGGVSAIQPGIESLSTPILRSMRKGVTALQNIRLLKWCAEIGVSPSWNLLYGFPGEDPAEYQRMATIVPLLVHLTPPQLLPVEFERFSPYFEKPEEFGLELCGAHPHYRFIYDVPAEELDQIAYRHAPKPSTGPDPEVYTADIAREIKRWRNVHESAAGSLIYRRGPGFLLVHDRRPGLEPADYQFDVLESRIFLACDSGAAPHQIKRRLAEDGEDVSESDIREFLESLDDAKLFFREGDIFLSLPIAGENISQLANKGDDQRFLSLSN